MQLLRNETNNAIITRLCNVRSHPNADRLQLATVLGAQVIVDLNAKDGDLVVYFDSNLRLSHQYLSCNNLYSNSELNVDTTKKGYFGKNGRVRAQRFRGEISNGYVAGIESLFLPGNCNWVPEDLKEGDEFISIGGEEICSKFIVPTKTKHVQGQSRPVISEMFHKHWDTKQLMRELDSIPEDALCFVEEKIHGTSGRTGNVLCKTNRPWWKFWLPKEEWRIVSGTRRVDNIDFHLPTIRKEIEKRVAPHLHRGEQIYYEIYGYDGGKQIQAGFPYDCRGGEFKVLLYRVTITTPDGHCYDLSRKQVYRRAEELGLKKPYLIEVNDQGDYLIDYAQGICKGRSNLDAATLLEGVVVWFEDIYGSWKCLKHKSEEFLLDQDGRMEKNEGDIEDNL
ncbi:MAG: hypothetical protein ACTSQY_05285 [Candidatus Odinarchaeia archaeon]